jgi:hypothetical protein
MANTVASQTILDGNRTAIQKFTFLCDGSGDESAVLKVDVSTLLPNEFGKACNGVTILKIYGSTHGVNVEILWDATTDLFCTGVPTDTFYYMDFSSFGGLPNNAGAGKTGDIRFTTLDADAGDFYSITLDMIKSYAS